MELRSGRRLRSLPPPQAGRRTTRSQGFSGGDDEDRIGALPDDLLLQVIERVGCPRAAARTGILSSRWRGLWTRIPRVTVTLDDIELSDLEAALARAACAGLHLLDIFVPGRYVEVTSFQVEAVLAAADRLSPVELRFDTCPSIRYSSSGVCLPSFSRATSIEMFGLRELMPAASGLPALERLSFYNEYGLRLGNLIQRCPCLRVLDLDLGLTPRPPMLDVDLRIHSTSLEELRVKRYRGRDLVIDIMAPMLKKLDLTVLTSYAQDVIAISIWAPVMEEIFWSCSYVNSSARIGILWRLGRLQLTAVQRRRNDTMPYNGEDNTCLYLPIFPDMTGMVPAEWDLVEEIRKIKNTFPAVEFTTLKLEVILWKTGHVFGPLVLSLLEISWIRRATRRLEINLKRRNIEQWCARGTNCPCDQPGNWRTKSNSLTLINLEEVEIEGFEGLDDEFDFLKVVFQFALKLKKVNVKVSDKVTPSALKKIDNMFKEYPRVECCVTSAPVSATRSVE
ncbi:hypothetical protein QYE76_003032 [Lolium multiflorum]|uniref:FBD domain-containing protein n=1 Tax=Lolium multiflorum TaxID=4521 RepID=A0AAD8RQ46_LOLMU|nr:hypothetical protein QYE76_003032 [Lolium multiflorum]